MEYFKSGLKVVLGSQQDAQLPTGAETVEKLVDRVQTSTLLDDRRDACRALKALSKKFRLEVGAQAMDALIRVLESDRADNEILGYALEAICNVISGSQDEEEYVAPDKTSEDLGLQFTEIFIKKADNVTLLLELMEEYDFKVRWPVVKLLTGLLVHKPKDLQECILVSPMGVSRLMDLLSDTREIIRNDTLLLLAHLTKGNANIQKIVAFENGFDKLLDVIREEGCSDGGVIVEDCLLVLLTLLKSNSSNQNFFKEGSYIQHLTPFFDLHDASETGWSAQKVTNINMMLQVVRMLVSPNNPQQVTASSQKAMYQYGLLEQLCNILMATGVPADILTETINTVAEVIRGNHGNQEYFSSVTAPISPPRPAIVVLLMSMVNDKQPFSLRCAVLYCFQCFLYKNELGQAQIVQTLLPSTADAVAVTVGQLLCGGLFSVDTLSNWFAAVALSHALVDNPTQKEQLLRVQLATSVGNPPVSLINQCALILQQGGKLQTRLGLLMLMSMWLANCTLAVTHFLSISTNIPFLTSQVSLAEGDENEDLVQGICAFLLGICIEFNDNSQQSFTKEDLCQLIRKRIGLETFLDKLSIVSKNEHYSKAAQNPHLKFKQPSEVLFDYEFCKLFKSLEGVIIKAIQPKPQAINGPESSMTPEQQGLLQQYKDVIRDQDMQIQELRRKVVELTNELEKSKVQVDDMSSTVQQLKDQNTLFKAERAVSGGSSSQELLHLKGELKELRALYEMKQKELDEAVEKLNQIGEHAVITSEESQNDSNCNNSHHLETIKQQKSEIEGLKEAKKNLETELCSLKDQSLEIKRLTEEKESLQAEKSEIEKQLVVLQKEQEDMLVLLTEQGDKLAEYRQRLKNLGEKVDEDEDESDLDDDLSDLRDDLSESKDEQLSNS